DDHGNCRRMASDELARDTTGSVIQDLDGTLDARERIRRHCVPALVNSIGHGSNGDASSNRHVLDRSAPLLHVSHAPIRRSRSCLLYTALSVYTMQEQASRRAVPRLSIPLDTTLSTMLQWPYCRRLVKRYILLQGGPHFDLQGKQIGRAP